MANNKHKIALKKNIEALFEKYQNIPIHQFVAYLQELRLELLIQEEGQNIAVVDENCQQKWKHC